MCCGGVTVVWFGRAGESRRQDPAWYLRRCTQNCRANRDKLGIWRGVRGILNVYQSRGGKFPAAFAEASKLFSSWPGVRRSRETLPSSQGDDDEQVGVYV
jgi:hypothetical protein